MLKVSQRIEELKGKHATLEKSNEESKKRERELRESRVDTNERREKLARLQNENIRRVMLSEKSNVLKVHFYTIRIPVILNNMRLLYSSRQAQVPFSVTKDQFVRLLRYLYTTCGVY